ncbi:hypothetical protein [Limimaricola pyoseonensis]|uniref:hypothetical protein n=1 Tax=Limimaricola pyoseonensis TaxID=521013 RepID=UPI0010424122|nr:hypothetical protein [Limimaricola pyoseonensis]
MADQPAQVTSVSAIDANGASQRVGSVSLVTGSDRDGAKYATDTVELAVSWDGSDDTDYIQVPVGDEFFKNGSTTVVEDQDQYGNRILIVENESMGRRLYLPPEGSDVFVGALSSNHDENFVTHAIFGRETLAEEIANVKDGFRFQGWAEASVVATDADGGPGRSGTYRGASGGHVDFVNGDFGLAATLRQNPESRESFGVQAWGTVTADGELIDTEAAFINARRDGEQFEGVFDGQVYGPEATHVGGTFSGNIDDEMGSASIVGQMLLGR